LRNSRIAAWIGGTSGAFVAAMMFRLLLTGAAAAAVGTLAAAPVHAQPKPAAPTVATDDMAAFEKDLDALFVQGGLTANGAAARAAKVSPDVHRKAAEFEAAQAQLEQVKLSEIPQLSGKASYTRLSKLPGVSFSLGPSMDFSIQYFQNQYDLTATLAVPLSDYLLRFPSLTAAAQLGADAARVSQVSTEVNAGQNARVAYYEWLRAKLGVLVAERQLAQVQTTLAQVQALAEVQRLSKADLLRVEAQEAQAEHTLDQLQMVAKLREEQLRILIGEPDTQLAIGEDIRRAVAAPPPQDLDQLLQQATGRRLEFRQIDLGIEAKEKQRQADLANALPALSAFATIDDARPNQRVFPQTDEFKLTWLAGAQITWELGGALDHIATSRRLRAEQGELRADRENLSYNTRLELMSAQQDVQLALSSIKTTKKELAAAEEGYRVRKELLEADRATAVELVDAETTLTRARIDSLNARVDLREALSRLAHALGEDAPRHP
jgi:outer membrane protein TolC